MITRIIGQEEQCVMPLVKALVDALSKREYGQFCSLVDDMGAYSMEILQEAVEDIIEDAGEIDPFGVSCGFHPNYAYHQWEFYHLNDGSGMRLDYDLTSSGALNDWTLQLEFHFEQDQIKVIFEDLHIL